MTINEMKEMLSHQTTAYLLDEWELTSNREYTAELPMVRGWLMDELESRFPKAFEAWLDSEECKDEDLKWFIYDIAA